MDLLQDIQIDPETFFDLVQIDLWSPFWSHMRTDFISERGLTQIGSR